MNNTELVDTYLSDLNYSKEQIDFLERESGKLTMQEYYKYDEQYTALTDTWFKNCSNCNISSKDYTLNCYSSGTEGIITMLEKHIDKDTLLICSNREHQALMKVLNKIPNKLIVDYDTEILKNNFFYIKQVIQTYKKVVVYCIGTTMQGFITPSIFLVNLKKILVNSNIEHIMILDDCQGMFYTPRDYSIFDYILYTCHVQLPSFDMGVVISKKEKELPGTKSQKNIKHFLDCFEIFKKEDIRKVYNFKYMCETYFGKYLACNRLYHHPNCLCADTIWSVHIPHLPKDQKTLQKIEELLNEYEMHMSYSRDDELECPCLYIRCFQYMIHPQFLQPGLKTVENILNTYQILD